MVIKIDDDGNLVEDKLWSGLEFSERLPYFSITSTSLGGISWVAEHKRKGTWMHKWGLFEDTVTVYTKGGGGLEIDRTIDGGFVIGTMNGTLIKTDGEFFYVDEGGEVSQND